MITHRTRVLTRERLRNEPAPDWPVTGLLNSLDEQDNRVAKLEEAIEWVLMNDRRIEIYSERRLCSVLPPETVERIRSVVTKP